MMTRRLKTALGVCAVAAIATVTVVFASLCAARNRSAHAPTAVVGAGGGKVAAAAAARPIVGVISGAAGWADPSQRLNQVLPRTRAKWVREGFFWDRIEASPGRFRFGHYDRFMVLAARRHEHVLGLLYEAPGWASPTPNTQPADPSTYAAFVAAVVHRYGPHGTLWRRHPKLRNYAISTFDLWNEPYYDNGNNGNYDPARYARLVKAAGGAAHFTDPSVKVLASAEMEGTLYHGKWEWWVDSMYRAVPDLNGYFDGVSVHPYGRDITHRSPYRPGHEYDGYRQMRRIELIRQQFVRHHAASKPFWVTEVGWPTCSGGSDRCVNPAAQVASLDHLMYYASTIWSGYVRAVFVYYFDDSRGGRFDPEANYGLTYSNHVAKPVLSVFRSFARRAPVNAW